MTNSLNENMYKTPKVANLSSISTSSPHRNNQTQDSLKNQQSTDSRCSPGCCSSSTTTNVVKYHDNGLRNLFFVHRLMGISYFGASVPSKKMSIIMQIVLIMWNMAAFAFSYYTFYVSISDTPEVPAAEHEDNPEESFLGKNALAPLVNYIRFSSLLVYYIFSYVLNLYNGLVARSLVRLIASEILPLMDSDVECKIGTAIAMVQTVIITFLTIVFQLLLYAKFKQILWIRWAENVLNLFSLSCTVALIAYINLSLGHVIRTTGEQGNISVYIQRLLQIGPALSKVTYLLSPAIMILILNATIVCVASLTLLVADFQSTFFISIIGFLDYGTVLISLVLVSSYAYETTKRTNSMYKVQLSLAICQYNNQMATSISSVQRTSRVYSNNNHYPTSQSPLSSSSSFEPIDCPLITNQLAILCNLEQDIQMQPFGLFHLTRHYVVTFFAFMLSYSVILIQTSESSVPVGVPAHSVPKNYSEYVH